MSYIPCVCSTAQLNELNVHSHTHKVRCDAANFNALKKTAPGAARGLLYNFEVAVENVSSYNYFGTRL